MPYEIFARVCVGAQLRPDAAVGVHDEFVASLGLDAAADGDAIFDALRFQTARHKLHEPDRVRYERALEAFIDAKWNVDFAIGGASPGGVFEPRRGYLFVGVRVEGFETVSPELPRGAAAVDRVQWLRKGDLVAGSDLTKTFGGDARKSLEHAGRSFARASREIVGDARARLKTLPIRLQHEVDWALCRWAVDAEHPSVMHRHGRE